MELHTSPHIFRCPPPLETITSHSVVVKSSFKDQEEHGMINHNASLKNSFVDRPLYNNHLTSGQKNSEPEMLTRKVASGINKSSSFVDKYLTEKSVSTKKSSQVSVESEKPKKTVETFYSTQESIDSTKPFSAKDSSNIFLTDFAILQTSTESTSLVNKYVDNNDFSRTKLTEDFGPNSHTISKLETPEPVKRKQRSKDKAIELPVEKPTTVVSVRRKESQSTDKIVESVKRKEISTDSTKRRELSTDRTMSNSSVRPKEDTWRSSKTALTEMVPPLPLKQRQQQPQQPSYGDYSESRNAATSRYSTETSSLSTLNPLRHSKSVGGWSAMQMSCRHEEG